MSARSEMKTSEIKLLIISTTKFELDGITNVILNYFRAMDKSNMQIDFAFPNVIRNDLRVELELFNGRIYKMTDRKKRPFSYMNDLTRLIRENDYDIVHAHGNSSTLALEMVAAKRGGAKVRIAHSHTKNKYKWLHRAFRSAFQANYTHAFACGQEAGEWLYRNEPFEIINNGIDIDKFMFDSEMRQDYRNKFSLTGKKVIGHIGNFSTVKNQSYLIDIFEELYNRDHDYRLLLIGDGRLRADIEKKVDDLGLSQAVIFTGKTFEVPQLLQAMDSFVMPSLFEGFPLTLVEAQTACLPCYVADVISKETGITDLVHFISLKKSPGDWADIINEGKTINRPARKEEIIESIIASGYCITDNAKKLKALYQTYYASEDGV